MDLVFEQYAERLIRKRKSPHTRSGFHTAAKRLDAWLKAVGTPAGDASYELLDEYFDELDLAPSSKATHLRHIQAAYTYAVKRGTLRHNPALDVEVEQTIDREPTIIPAGELRRIRANITWEHDWLLFHLLAYTGMRRSEIRGLHWDDGSDDRSVVRSEQQTIRVMGKGGKLRLIPIHPALGEALSEVRPKLREPGKAIITARGGKPVTDTTITSMSHRLHETYRPHDYRRTVATSLARNGVEERIIDRILGWAPRSVRGKYYINIATEELHRGILRLYADDPL